MKRINNLVRPFFAIIFGALLLLFYLNVFPTENPTSIALGVIALVVAAFYLCYGVLSVVLGTRLPAPLKKILDLLTVVVYPTFMFVVFLLNMISISDPDIAALVSPTGWIILITNMAVSITFAGLYVAAYFAKVNWLKRLANLFAFILILAFLLDVLFQLDGTPVNLGGITVIEVIIYASFSSMLLSNLFTKAEGPTKDNAPEEQEDAPVEEPKEEPAEEKPAEEEPKEEKAE